MASRSASRAAVTTGCTAATRSLASVTFSAFKVGWVLVAFKSLLSSSTSFTLGVASSHFLVPSSIMALIKVSVSDRLASASCRCWASFASLAFLRRMSAFTFSLFCSACILASATPPILLGSNAPTISAASSSVNGTSCSSCASATTSTAMSLPAAVESYLVNNAFWAAAFSSFSFSSFTRSSACNFSFSSFLRCASFSASSLAFCICSSFSFAVAAASSRFFFSSSALALASSSRFLASSGVSTRGAFFAGSLGSAAAAAGCGSFWSWFHFLAFAFVSLMVFLFDLAGLS
mmetsp:Transcript_77729/g.207652  ORF Transcript_77729/g.207652 Transcript_77729/m.207652 type:complete len:291 (-) Transcript_77729:1199-2071(-)